MSDELKSLGLNISVVAVKDLQPYPKNYNRHSKEQVEELGKSLKGSAGQYKNIVVWNGFIIAGHGLVEAAKAQKVSNVAANDVSHLSQEEAEALLVSDNATAAMATPDPDALRVLLEGIPDFEDIPGVNREWLNDLKVSMPGFENEEDEKYTKKITAPIYEPVNEKPKVTELMNQEKATALVREIEKASDDLGLTEEEKDFLIAAARRHTVFNFEKIADFYAHSPAGVQDLMEKSALVIIDFEKAIEHGFTRLSERVADQYREDYPDED